MRKNNCLYLVIVTVFSTVAMVQSTVQIGSANETLIMASTRKENTSDEKALKLIFTEAFKRMGKELVYRHYPMKRGSLIADMGIVDGELGRVYHYNKKHPNLIRVEEPIISIKLSAFATNQDIKLKGWESLIGTGYRVEYIRGSQICAEKLPKVVDKDKLSVVRHWPQAFNKLVAGRTDIFVEMERTFLDALTTTEHKKSEIYIAGVMEEQTVHAYLHKKHKALVPKLSMILKEMKQEGLVEKFIRISSGAKELIMAFGQNRPPFAYEEKGVWKGIEIDIVREALKFNGHTILKEIHMSNKRLEKAVKFSVADGAASVQYLDDNTFYSDNFVIYKNYAFSKKSDKLMIYTIQDLTQFKVAAWQNAYRNLGSEFMKYYGPINKADHHDRYKEFYNQKSQNEFFWNGRADVIIVDKTIFQWFRKQLSVMMDTSQEIVIHDIFSPETHYQVNFREKRIRDDFNEGLQHLRDTGKYQRIIESYTK